MAGAREAEAGFAIGTYHEDHIEENARERAHREYGDPEWTAEMVSQGLLSPGGSITERGWEVLNQDIDRIERNSMAWLRRTFKHVRDDGHSGDELVGNVWYDPTNYDQAWLIDLASDSPGRSERVDMSDASYGDLANTAFDGVSSLGESVLGGQITFFDVQPEDWETIEETLSQQRPNASERASGKLNTEQIASMFGLPAYDDLHERNIDYFGDAGFEARKQALADGATEEEADEADMKAQEEADREMFQQWHGAVMHAAETLFGHHGLVLTPVGKGDYAFEYRVAPEKSWEDAARKLIETINGVGEWHFSSLREFLDSGPYTARQAVLSHLHWIKDYPAVYGDTSAERMYESSMRY